MVALSFLPAGPMDAGFCQICEKHIHYQFLLKPQSSLFVGR